MILNRDNFPGTGRNFRTDLFFELSADLLCIAGFDGYFKKINPAVSTLLGYTEQELLSRPVNDFVHPADKDVTGVKRTNLTKNIPLINFENRYLTRSGEVVWLSWTSMPLESEKLVYAIAKNITHKKKLDDDRNLLISNLTRINSDLRQINYTASHDLRTPVGNLLSVFNLLDTSKIQDRETLEFIGILKTSSEHLKYTLDNYLDALIHRENADIKVEDLNLYDTLQSVLQSLRSLISDTRASLKIDFSKANYVKFNKACLESIFLNMISNSIKYAKRFTIPEIHIYTTRVNGKTQLIFADKGIGFDMDKVKGRVFGFQQKFHEHADSKGIGLYLVYNHVTSLGGTVTLNSQVDEGAEFTITFRE